MLSPIAIFAFNRPEHLGRTLIALAANELASQSDVTIFCDGPRTAEEKKLTDATRLVARDAQGFASITVVERDKNMGCAASVIDGLQHMFAKCEKLIIIEDDIACSRYTLSFFNAGLERYREDAKVFHIAAWSPPAKIFPLPSDYAHDVYAIPRFNCWGWASWKDRFDAIDWTVSDYETFKNSPQMREAFNRGGEDLSGLLDSQMEGKVDSWAIRADYSRFKHGQYGINPVISYAMNIGFGCGTHTTKYTDKYDNDVALALSSEQVRWLHDVAVDERILARYQEAFAPALWHRCVRFCMKKIGIWYFLRKLFHFVRDKKKARRRKL